MKIHNEYLWLVLIAVIIIVGPLLSIWALNTLFPVLVIPYTFETWAAILLVSVLCRGGIIRKD